MSEACEACMVYFRRGECDLDDAAHALAGYGLSVTRDGDQFTAGWPGSPQFRVHLDVGEQVLAEAAVIAEGTPHAAAMRECGARFVIAIDDLEEALEEINTLMEVQGALQDTSQGYLFVPWTGNLSEPWQG